MAKKDAAGSGLQVGDVKNYKSKDGLSTLHAHHIDGDNNYHVFVKSAEEADQIAKDFGLVLAAPVAQGEEFSVQILGTK